MINVPKVNSSNISEFISQLFASRTQAHIYHLQTTSYAAHKALDEYYSGIIDLADSIAEQYQGKYGIIKGYKVTPVVEDDNYIKYFEGLRGYITTSRNSVFKSTDTEIQNIIDEVLSLLNSTIYKLKFLK